MTTQRDLEVAVLDRIRDWGRRHPVGDLLGAYLIACVGAWLLGMVPAVIGMLIVSVLLPGGFNPDDTSDVWLVMGGGTLVGGLIVLFAFESTGRVRGPRAAVESSAWLTYESEWAPQQMKAAEGDPRGPRKNLLAPWPSASTRWSSEQIKTAASR